MKKQIVEIGWAEYLIDCVELATMVEHHINLTFLGDLSSVKIYGIPRGGLIPATIIAHRLNCQITFNLQEADILIDDLYDTGATLRNIRKQTQAPFGCVYSKHAASEEAMRFNFVKRFKSNQWLKFPYETEQSTCKDV